MAFLACLYVIYIQHLQKHLLHLTLSSLILWYYEMGMLQFIEPIAISISDINNEIKDSGYPNPIFHQLEYAFNQIKLREESIVRNQEARIRLQKANERNMSSDRRNSLNEKAKL